MIGKLLESASVKKLFGRFEIYSYLLAARDLRWKRKKGRTPLYVDYPPNPNCRWGYGAPPHPELFKLISNNQQSYLSLFESFSGYSEFLERIPCTQPNEPAQPFWLNGWFQGLDPLALYCILSQGNPEKYIEIGSGNSTKFARRAIIDHSLQTTITSIDPNPRAEIDGICDRVIRQRLEDIGDLELAALMTLSEGDILVVDNSHRCFMNSDVTVVFLEILPRLSHGVLVYIDDIYLPFDYPPSWSDRWYSEQYLLATLILSGNHRYEILFPATFFSRQENA